MGTFGAHNLTMQRGTFIPTHRGGSQSKCKISLLLKNGYAEEREGGEGERVIPPPVTFRSSKISHTLKNGSKWVLSGHTISPCSSVLKNGSKWVLSGHTISPCGAAPSYLRTGTEANQNAKFLSYSKI